MRKVIGFCCGSELSHALYVTGCIVVQSNSMCVYTKVWGSTVNCGLKITTATLIPPHF